MIKPNELMIDNWVLHSDRPIKVKGIIENRIASFDNEIGVRLVFSHKVDEIEPITITEEILEKCGFENTHDNEFYATVNNSIEVFIYKDNDSSFRIGKNDADIEIKYIHQLQNSYFILTGEQLTIKL